MVFDFEITRCIQMYGLLNSISCHPEEALLRDRRVSLGVVEILRFTQDDMFPKVLHFENSMIHSNDLL